MNGLSESADLLDRRAVSFVEEIRIAEAWGSCAVGSAIALRDSWRSVVECPDFCESMGFRGVGATKRPSSWSLVTPPDDKCSKWRTRSSRIFPLKLAGLLRKVTVFIAYCSTTPFL